MLPPIHRNYLLLACSGDNSLIIKCLHWHMDGILDGGLEEEREWESPHPAFPLCDMYLEPQSTGQSQDSVPRKHPRQTQLTSTSFPASHICVFPCQSRLFPCQSALAKHSLPPAGLPERFPQVSQCSPPEDNSLHEHPRARLATSHKLA